MGHHGPIVTTTPRPVLAVGDLIRFKPQSGNRWWTVRAVDTRYIVATQPAPLTSGDLHYTVVDFTAWAYAYNGGAPVAVRSSLNTLGGGYDVGPDGANCANIIDDLRSGLYQLSNRRRLDVTDIEAKPTRKATTPS